MSNLRNSIKRDRKTLYIKADDRDLKHINTGDFVKDIDANITGRVDDIDYKSKKLWIQPTTRPDWIQSVSFENVAIRKRNKR